MIELKDFNSMVGDGTRRHRKDATEALCLKIMDMQRDHVEALNELTTLTNKASLFTFT